MAIPFSNIPGNLRVAFFYAEFRSGGTPYISNARLLLIGQKAAGGSAIVGEPVMVRDGQESLMFGTKSMLTAMALKARHNAPIQEIWALPLADLDAGTAATGTLTISAPAWTEAKQCVWYIGGRRVALVVNAGATAAATATALAAEINRLAPLPDANRTVLPISAAASAAVVTITADHKGTLGNLIEIDMGAVDEDGPWARQITTVAAMSGGAGDPDLTTPLGNLGDDEYDWIGSPYGDNTTLGIISTALSDVNGRWSWMKQTYGHYITQRPDTVGTFAGAADSRNNQHLTIMPSRKVRSTPWEYVAATAAKAAQHLQTPPELSRPLQTIVLEGILPPLLKADRLSTVDRQSLYYSGISGYHVTRDGRMALDRVLTTYRKNSWGDPDWTYLDIETMAQSMYGIRYIRTYVTTKHPRKALVRENVTNNPSLVDVKELRLDAIHAYAQLVDLGVFEDVEGFARVLDMEINALEPNRVDAYLPLDHVNQLRIFAALAVNQMQRAA